MDIMFDLQQFRTLQQEERERLVAAKIMTELPPVLKKYKFESFDAACFEADLGNWFKQASVDITS